MKIVILAGGKSERIAPFSEKPLLKICGKTLIRHQLEMLAEAGGRDFLIIGNSKNLTGLREEGEKFWRECPWMANDELKIDYAEQVIDEGSAGALKSAENKLGDEGLMIVSSNDILEMSAYTTMLEMIEENPGSSVVLGQQIEKYFPGGYLVVNHKDELEKIVEKPGEGNEPSDFINIVVHFHPNSKELMGFIQRAESEVDDLYETSLQMMINEGKRVIVARYNGKWQAIKFPWHIYDASKMLFEKEMKMRGTKDDVRLIASDLRKAESALIKGDVIIENGVRIMENSVIIGPAYLGRNVVICNNSLVRESFIGDESLIGFASEIARSYLAERVTTHSNYIGDSILGKNVTFGEGSVTGNLRLDEKAVKVEIKGQKIDSGRHKLGLIAGNNVHIGINVSLMPGVKIGCNTMIAGGVLVDRDIPEGKFVKLKNDLEIRDNLELLR